MLLTAVVNAFNYPVIVSGDGYNHTEVKQLVYSIPIKYFVHVDKIEFIKRPTVVLGNHIKISSMVRDGYVRVMSYFADDGVVNKVICTDVQITLHEPQTIFHELGHVYDICELNNIDSTEEFADLMGEKIESEVIQ